MIKKMLDTIASGNLTESRDNFNSIIAEKIEKALIESKISVAQQMFGKAIDESKDEDDSCASSHCDEDDKDEPLYVKLKKAQSLDDNPLSHDNDSAAVQSKLAAKELAGVSSTQYAHRTIPLTQGSVTLQDGEAGKIKEFLDNIKPEKRQEILTHMQKSPTHFGSIHDVVKKFS